MTATRAKTSFLSSTSHELQPRSTPSSASRNSSRCPNSATKTATPFERILGAGRHLLTLINELIDIARIESGDLSLSLEPVLIRPLIEECSQLMAPIAAERSIRIIQQCPHPALATHADRHRLSQVLINLISNAVKYNHRGGTITIACRRGRRSRQHRGLRHRAGHLFRKHRAYFRPLRASRRRADRGRGHRDRVAAGQALTEAMHGRLTASSVPGKGSAFTVSLPRARTWSTSQPRASRKRHQRPGRTPGPEPASAFSHRGNPANVELVTRFLRGKPNIRLRSEASGRRQHRKRHPGRARPRPARPAPARHARRPGTQRAQGRIRPPPPSPWLSFPPTPPAASSTACSPAARSPTSPSPSNSPNSARCSTPSPQPGLRTSSHAGCPDRASMSGRCRVLPGPAQEPAKGA